MAIAALVLGISGAVLCFVFVPSILALIFGLVAARDIKRSAAAGCLLYTSDAADE